MRRNLQSENGIQSWTISEFHIRQLLPANGAKAVFIIDCADKNLKLEAVACCFLGLASETITYWKKGADARDRQVRVQTIENAIVCIDIRGGYERILNEAPNFAGIQMPGQSIHECIGQAHSDLLVKLPSQDTTNERMECHVKTESRA